MSRLPNVVRKVLVHARQLGLPGGGVLLAVSGGADSMALLLAFEALQRTLGGSLEVATLDHGLRPGSREDARFVQRQCRKLKIPCHVRRVQVTGRGGLEAAARRVRYRALEEIAAARGLAFIATGHTVEDQVETILQRLARGAGGRGARGILEQRGRIVRPLLTVTRAEVAHYLAQRRVTPRLDPTNALPDFDRNRVRMLVLPAIEKALGRAALTGIARSASLLSEDERYLSSLARKRARRLFKQEGQTVTATAASLTALPKALERRVLREGLKTVGVKPTALQVEAIRTALRSADPARGSLPLGAEFENAYGILTVVRTAPEQAARFSHALPERGTMALPLGRVSIRPAKGKQVRPDTIRLDPADLTLPLLLRSRLPGDRFRPQGGHGKKLKAFLIDAKIRAHERDRVPLLVDSSGRVLWVVGVRRGDAAVGAERAGEGLVEVSVSLKASGGKGVPLEQEKDNSRSRIPARLEGKTVLSRAGRQGQERPGRKPK